MKVFLKNIIRNLRLTKWLDSFLDVGSEILIDSLAVLPEEDFISASLDVVVVDHGSQGGAEPEIAGGMLSVQTDANHEDNH